MKKKIVFALLLFSVVIKSTKAQYWSALGNGIGYPRWNMVYNSEGTESGTDAPVTGDPVASLCFYNGELYAGGFFDYTNGPASNIVKYNGDNWSSVGGGVHTVGGGGFDSWVNELMVYKGELYVAGRFTHAGNTEANNIVKWNGSQWEAVGNGLGEYGNEVSSLVIYNGELYAGGHFNKSGDVQINNIAKWNGDQWLPVGSGIDVYMDYFPYGSVSSLVVHNGDLYAGGNFDTTGVGTNNIVKWDGTSWSAVGTGINNSVFCLATYNGALFAGGNFINLMKWDGNDWSELSPGISGYVFSLMVNHSILYAGGSFDTAGQVAANNIAQWNGTEWSTLGKGMNNGVSCMTAYDHAFFAGGNFDIAGNIRANRISKWTEQCTTPPVSPENIIGSSVVCQNHYSTFSVNQVNDAEYFTWTLPAGWTGNSSSNRIVIRAGTSGGVISVRANNPCGSSNPQIIPVHVIDSVPAQLDTITGQTFVCANSIQSYSIKEIPSATFYQWILPSGWQGDSKTNTISVKIGTTGGIISVRAGNHCSSSAAQMLAITVDSHLIQAGQVSGDNMAKIGQTVAYSINQVPNAKNYSWSLSNGGIILSGQNTHSVSVKWLGAGEHVLTVQWQNSCGTPGLTLTKTISVSAVVSMANPGSQSGISIIPNPSSGKFYLNAKEVENKLITVQLANMMGQMVYTTVQMRGSANYVQLIDLEKLPPGNYLARIIVNDTVYVRKILKINK